MARSIWKGSISFGLLNVPVTVYPGEQRHDISFHLLDSRDNARVRYQRVNEDTGEEVPWSEVVKAFEYDDGSYVLMTEDDFASVAVEASQTVEIQSFVPRSEIETVYFEKPYFLEPGKRGEKGYVLLREVLARTERVGIARVVIRTREYLAALIPWGDALVLELLRYPQELRDANDLDLPAGDHVAVPEAPDAEPTKIVDIMAVLRKSLEAKASPTRGKRKTGKATAKKATKKTTKKAKAPKARRAAG